MGTDRQTGSAGEQTLERVNPLSVAAGQASADGIPSQLPAEVSDAVGAAQQSTIRRVPVEVDVSVPVRRFRVRDVLALNRGQVIVTRWMEGEDMPLAAHGAQLAWTEIEVIDQRLAVRITRLA
jgi:flagellar motor switch protein FliN/FliY